jgi:hypothetical protein
MYARVPLPYLHAVDTSYLVATMLYRARKGENLLEAYPKGKLLTKALVNYVQFYKPIFRHVNSISISPTVP